MSNYTLQTARTTMAIIDHLHSNNSMTVEEIAEELDLNRTTVYGYVNTLQESNFIVKEGDQYTLSLKFVGIGKTLRERNPSYHLGEEYVDRVARETGLRALFAVEENGKGIIIAKDDGEYPAWPHEKVGVTFFLHSTAAGKAILSGLSEQRRTEIVERHGLPRQTSQTTTSVDNLNNELEQIQREGFAINNEEYIDGIVAIAIPVRDRSGDTIGALAANCPAGDTSIAQLKDDVLEVMERTLDTDRDRAG